jgi:Co/Zn/Cd efflux system component
MPIRIGRICITSTPTEEKTMADCCEDAACAANALKDRHARVLKAVLAINAIMFVVEASMGVVAGYAALMGDSLDMLGDALAYGVSLYVLGKGPVWNARAALLKGGLMAGLGLLVLGEAAAKALHPGLPAPVQVGATGLLALAANLICLGLLMRHRSDDLNMRSVWLCSRNDILVNAGVLASAAAVHFTGSRWPDVTLGAAIALVVLRSVLGVTRRALAEGAVIPRGKASVRPS